VALYLDDLDPASPLIDRIRASLCTGAVSFAELSKLDGFNGEGVFGTGGNLVLWVDVSREAAEALKQLIIADECHCEPVSPFIYTIDGMTLDLPVAKRAVAYRRPHWLPVVLNPGPAPEQKSSTSRRPDGTTHRHPNN
jgi:hypothetical protein